MSKDKILNKALPKHIALILDGNGRWAKKRGLPRTFGHYRGALNIGTIASYADKLGIETLTIYAFSTENWNRPKDEVEYLMTMPIQEFPKYKDKIANSNIKITQVGSQDKLSNGILNLIKEIETLTEKHTGLTLQVAFNYGSYDELLHAYKMLLNEGNLEPKMEDIYKHLYVKQPVDLLIRTSGEQRLSNYLLWQASYAELYFIKRHWPAFRPKDLDKAIKHYQKRDRRFGGIKA